MNGLSRIQMRFGKIAKISQDQGTNLLVFHKLADESNGLLDLETVTDAPVGAQYKNYVERRIQVIKRLIRIMTRT